MRRETPAGDRQGLVDHLVAGDQHRLDLGALGKLGAVDEVDGLAHGLARGIGQDARGHDVRARGATALTHHVVDVEHVGAGGLVAGVQREARGGACQVAAQAAGHLGPAQRVLAHLDARTLGDLDAYGVQVLLAFAAGDDLHNLDLGVTLGHHAQKRCGGGVGCGTMGAGHDGCAGTGAHEHARVRHFAAAGVDVHVDGLLAHLAGLDLKVGGIAGGAGDPGERLVADAALHAVKQSRQARVDVAHKVGLGHGERNVVDAQVVPGLRGWHVDVREGGGVGLTGRDDGVGHYPIAPSISSLIRLFISMAYSMGSSLLTGSAKPLTTMVRASLSEQPRLMR